VNFENFENFPKIYGLVEQNNEIDRQLAQQSRNEKHMTKICENEKFAKKTKNQTKCHKEFCI